MVRGNILSIHNPELLAEWDYEKNSVLGIYPSHVSYGSRKKVYWRCFKDDRHVWDAIIRNRSSGRGCPVCQNKKIVPGINDLFTHSPGLLNEWDSVENSKIGLSPFSISAGSDRRAHWKCSKNHMWVTKIKNRTMGKTRCPTCYQESKYINNDLASNYPELLKEWDYAKNNEKGIFPDKTSQWSNKRASWECEQGHQWDSRIDHRTYSKTSCPECHSQDSKIEKEIMGRLNILTGDVQTIYPWYSECTMAKCDGVDQDNKIIVEYDGFYWHKDKITTDVNKTRALLDSGYSVIRIREKGLQSLIPDVRNDNYHEINDVYPYNNKKNKEIDSIVCKIDEIMNILLCV